MNGAPDLAGLEDGPLTPSRMWSADGDRRPAGLADRAGAGRDPEGRMAWVDRAAPRRQAGRAGAGEKGAVIDGNYRYNLWRGWDDGARGRVLFIGLNPSTADAEQDDPTIRRCMRFARDWGYGGVWMANLYAHRSTDPKGLIATDHPVGPANDGWLVRLAEEAQLTVAAWGAWPGPIQGRAAYVANLIGGLHVLGLTKDGAPRHPLYMRADSQPQRWTNV